MAFKILSSNEIELLTENQRKSYEKELAIYNDRAKFVEQMEKFENTVITPYKPKLANIFAVSKAPEKTYSNPEYVVKSIDMVVKPMPKTAAVNFGEPVTAVVPKYSKAKNVSVEHIKKTEQNKPLLPKISKASVPDKTFKESKQDTAVLPKIHKTVVPVRAFIKSEQKASDLPLKIKTVIPSRKPKKTKQIKPNLPAAFKLQGFKEPLFASVSINNEKIKACNSNITSPTIKLPEVRLPEKTQPVLPQASVKCPEVKMFKVPEQTNIDLPKAIIPESFEEPVFASVSINNEKIKACNSNITPPIIKLPEVRLPEKTHPVLPQVSVKYPEIKAVKVSEQADPVLPKAIIPNQVNISFKLANTTKARLPEVSNISAVNASFCKSDIQKAELPIAQKVITPSKEFHKSKISLSNLPTVSTLKASVQSYIPPKFEKSDIPAFTKPVVTTESYCKPLVHNTLKVECPGIRVASVGPFKKVSGKINNFPCVGNVDIPDAYSNELIKNLLTSNKEVIARKGVLA